MLHHFFQKANIKILLICLVFSCSSFSQETISFFDRNGSFEAHVPTNSAGTASVLVNRQVVRDGGTSLFFVTGSSVEDLIRRKKPTSFVPSAVDDSIGPMVPLEISDLELVKFRDHSVAAAIYPIQSNSELKATAVHVLKHMPVNQINLNWYGFVDEREQLLDVAIGLQDDNVISLQNFLNSLEQPKIGNTIQIPHLTLIENTEDVTISQSVTKIIGASSSYFYFRNSQTSQVGPQSSGAVIYNLKENLPLGIVSCLVNTKSQGPAISLIRGVSFQALASLKIVKLTPEIIAHFKNNCEPYDGKRGGGD